MPERIILDPTEESAGRTQFDLTAWVANEGPDWGDGAISAYMADQSRGATPVDFRVPNRTVEIPLVLQARGGTSFATARALVQAKTSLFQREGGRGRRTTTAGSTVYFDIVNASLKLGGGWLQSAKDADLDATLTLECLPDFYEAEVQLADHTETSLSELVFTETTVRGDYPARVRVVVDEDDAETQLGLIWSFRNRHYSSAATAATRFEAEALNPLDGALRASLAGASGGTVVTHGTLSTGWSPVLDMRGNGTAYPTHTGTNRLWVRYRTASGTAVQLRAVYDVGDLVVPVENTPVRCQGGTQFFMADLGEVRLDPSPVGTHRWNAVIQGKGDAGAEDLSIDKVWVLNADEGYGVLRAPTEYVEGLTAPSARDGFAQSAGALVAKVAPVGGTWATGAGDADDFAVEATGHTAQRTAVSDTLDVGRYAPLGTTNYTDVVVQVDVKGTHPNGKPMGVLARYNSTTSYVLGSITFATDVVYVQLQKNAGAGRVSVIPLNFRVFGTPVMSQWYSIRLAIAATGWYSMWAWVTGGAPGDPVHTGWDADFATGGTLATGKPGIYDEFTGAGPSTRNYDNFSVTVPSFDVVTYASQSAELRWDGMVREDAAGAAYGPVPQVTGDLPRLPPTVEGRTTEVFIKASRGDFDTRPDTGIDDISARITYRPCWLTVPGT